MTLYCDGHAFDCGCTTECTKTIDIGRFEKTAPVFVPSPRFTLIVAAFLSVFFAGAYWMAEQAFERVRLANQETAKW